MKVQCCVLIDATASMGNWLYAAKNQISKIVDIINEENPGVELHMGAVFYRDYGDIEQLVSIPFTTDIPTFIQDIKPFEPEGGNDSAEDVAGGFLAMHEMDWDEDAVKNAFLICDSPPHGAAWHDIEVSDRFPENEYELSNHVLHAATRDIKLTIIRASSTLGTMIRKMDAIYKSAGKTITVADLEMQGARTAPTEDLTLVRAISAQVGDSIREY